MYIYTYVNASGYVEYIQYMNLNHSSVDRFDHFEIPVGFTDVERGSERSPEAAAV